MASVRDFFYVLTHYREIVGQIHEMQRIAYETEERMRETEEKMACFIRRMRTTTDEEFKITIFNN